MRPPPAPAAGTWRRAGSPRSAGRGKGRLAPRSAAALRPPATRRGPGRGPAGEGRPAAGGPARRPLPPGKGPRTRARGRTPARKPCRPPGSGSNTRAPRSRHGRCSRRRRPSRPAAAQPRSRAPRCRAPPARSNDSCASPVSCHLLLRGWVGDGARPKPSHDAGGAMLQRGAAAYRWMPPRIATRLRTGPHRLQWYRHQWRPASAVCRFMLWDARGFRGNGCRAHPESRPRGFPAAVTRIFAKLSAAIRFRGDFGRRARRCPGADFESDSNSGTLAGRGGPIRQERQVEMTATRTAPRLLAALLFSIMFATADGAPAPSPASRGRRLGP